MKIIRKCTEEEVEEIEKMLSPPDDYLPKRPISVEEFEKYWDDILKKCDSDFCFEQHCREMDKCECGHYAGLHKRLDIRYHLQSPYPNYLWGKCLVSGCDCIEFLSKSYLELIK